MRHYSALDRLITRFDTYLQKDQLSTTVTRPSPAEGVEEGDLTSSERLHAAGLMRINHVGEVCAQALYQGQALAARSLTMQKKLNQAAQEEKDHLAWCQQRLKELNTHSSYLNPVWYSLSWMLGCIAGLCGDKISLGFLAETEHQVERHLALHLHELPQNDKKSRLVVEQMRLEELMHATAAEQSGGIPLPLLIQWSMRTLAKVMTLVAYRV